MTSESEFSDRWRSEEPIYAAWGRFVGMTLSDAIQGRVAPTKLDLFLKLPVIPRLKERNSMLQKAFYRGKVYRSPYEDIEDKVGLRFVVLLTEDIRTIEAALKESSHWMAHLARDFELERDLVLMNSTTSLYTTWSGRRCRLNSVANKFRLIFLVRFKSELFFSTRIVS